MHTQHKLRRTHRPIWLACLGMLVSTGLMAPTADATSFSNALSWNLHLSLEGIDNFSGGIAPGAVGNATGKAGFAFDTRRAGWWSGGRFVTDGMDASPLHRTGSGEFQKGVLA
ncbi:MAG: hypothetical protein ACYCR3_09345 [Acidithiobacillus sp.]